jgi:hypothetical protein
VLIKDVEEAAYQKEIEKGICDVPRKTLVERYDRCRWDRDRLASRSLCAEAACLVY